MSPPQQWQQQDVQRLMPYVHRYAWGCPAESSVVAALARRTPACVNYRQQQQQQQQEQHDEEDAEPFAELWLGTHPNGCSFVAPLEAEALLPPHGPPPPPAAAAEPVSLLVHMQQQQQKEEGGALGALPFLLKVLSVSRSLSLQSHPDKELAAHLHASLPSLFRDQNHKPEMAVALGAFAALAGFKPPAAAAELLLGTPELQQALGDAFLNSYTGKAFLDLAHKQQQQQQDEEAELLKAAFAALLLADEQQQQQQQQALEALRNRLRSKPPPPPSLGDSSTSTSKQQQEEAEWVALQLLQVHPKDVGCFSAFFLNLVLLNDGEALFIPPNYMHCYLKGHCVEVMAASDNVIRGGLTSKPTDPSLLLNTLGFSPFYQKPHKVSPSPLPQQPEQQLLLLQTLCQPPGNQQQQQQLLQQQQQQQQQQNECCLYAPPLWRFPEFCMARVCLPRGSKVRPGPKP